MVSAIPKGYRNVKALGTLVYDPNYEERFESLSPNEYSSMIIKEIMNNQCHDLQFTTEDQYQFPNGYMPTLDFQLRLVTEGVPRII